MESLDSLVEAFSAARMGPYLAQCNGDVVEAFRIYAWNIEVSSAFVGPLNCLEVALRNALHNNLSRLSGVSPWWECPALLLHGEARKLLESTAAKLTKHNKDVNSDSMVAELTFGFWVSLLGKGKNYETTLWRPALVHAFPHYGGNRRDLHANLDSMRLLRNRIAHLEPIHARHLEADHRKILTLIGYISKEAALYVQQHDRVDEVLRRRNAVWSGATYAGF